jgi:hypothetical protein
MNSINTIVITAIAVVSLTACTEQPGNSYQGLYTWGHEVRSFQPCGSRQVYWVKTSPELQQELADYHQASTSRPYEAIYIEFMGAESDEERTGFARDYDGLIRIDALTTKSATIPPACSQTAN